MKRLLLVLIPLLFVACDDAGEGKKEVKSEQTTDSDQILIQTSYRDLSVDEFAEYNHDPNAVVLDVRTAPEWEENGVIPGAVQIDWYDADFDEKVSGIAKDKSVYVYCHGGGRSAEAAQKLIDLGYTDVFNLENGFESWAAAEKPVDTGAQ